MKAIIIVLLCLSAVAFAEESKFSTTLNSLLSMQAKAADAVDSALQLLRDLKQVNIDAQKKADEINKTMEAEYAKQIADLTYIADTNKASGDAATTYRKHLQDEIETTGQYLQWNTKRREEIVKQIESNREHRCESNFMFIKALKEHDEALEVIRFLREDIVGIVQEKTGQQIDFAQLKDSASKLSAYAHLFNKNALRQFNELTQLGPEEVDQEALEHDEKADDNKKEKLEMERMGAGTDSRNVGQKLVDAVDKLEEHLINSIKDFEKSEIKAAWDLSQWLQDIEFETADLEKEYEKKTTYMDKLLITIVGAKAHEDRQWEIYFESAAALNDTKDELLKKREWYMQEKARRDEENAILDDIIKMFIERVSVLDSGMRGKVDDYAEDKTFEDKSDIKRQVDTAYEKDKGQMAKNVAKESRA